MEIDHLREFLVLAETKNYWEASARLFISESALSKHIARLEKELDAPLFVRTTRRVELTPGGEKLLPCARAILQAHLSFREELNAMKEAEAGTLLLGVIPSMVQYGLTGLLADFRKKYPDTTIRILESDTADLLSALERGRCAAAFLREGDGFPVDPDAFVKIPYMTDRALTVLPESHPLAKENVIPLSLLADESFIMLKEPSVLREIFEDACMKQGFRPDIVFDCQRMDSIFDLVARGMGVSLVMDHHAPAAVSGLSFVPVTPVIESRIFLCYRKKNRPDKAVEKFTRFVRSADTGSLN